MAAPLPVRFSPFLRLRLPFHHQNRRPFCSFLDRIRFWSSTESVDQTGGECPSSAGENPDAAGIRVKDPPRCTIRPDPDALNWEKIEAEIMEDVYPVICLAKDILHSDRYMDGQRLTDEDEKIVVERLLAHHPHSEDKIGVGLDSIMVDQHPQFRHTRCMFVVRTDGGCIDFSYYKCLQRYVRDSYPTHAERFIKKHLCKHLSRARC
ncbi:unnamed protein product [Cuscuta campestris]|uniref:Protein DCL, chloroplastic n=1 Tax=Cuscuta campestris TaxID=132261 RepID=A0A484KJX8_9ASTE|nr:unnamed protein product [Cuscuta campestris]